MVTGAKIDKQQVEKGFNKTDNRYVFISETALEKADTEPRSRSIKSNSVLIK